jgi:hypothetical protein
LEKVVVLVILSTAKLSLLFLDFLRYLIDFTRCWTNTQNREQSIYTADLKTFKLFTHMPSVPPPSGPTAVASSPAARWSAARQTSDEDLPLDSPAIDWWRWTGRGGHRRAAAAEQRRCTCGNSNDGEGRGWAQPRAARGASMWHREDARQVTGLGGSMEGRARRRRSGGGRGNSGSGDRAARFD